VVVAVRAEYIQQHATVDLDRDRRLVLAYQAGDDGAFDELYRRYFPRLRLYCARRVGDSHVAEELAQEAFVKALRAMPSFAGERRFYPWMTVIAQRLCIDHHRRNARVEPAPEIDLGSIDEGHDHLYAEVDRDHLDLALDRLAPRHREVLDLREQQGWTYTKIAEHFDVPVTTVEALLHRARKALRREFLAVSGNGRLASLPVIGWVVARVGRLHARLGGSGGSLLPIASGAAAGLAALGLVLGPVVTGSGHGTPPPSVRTVPAGASTTTSAAVTVPPMTAAAAQPAAHPARTGVTAPTTTTPAPAANAGVAQVYTGPAATAWATEQAQQQPVELDLGPLLQLGVNPFQLISDLLTTTPGGPS